MSLTLRHAAIAALSAFVASPVLAADPPKDDGASDSPYPAAAQALNLPGRAILSCKASAEGALSNCKLVSEDPEGWGFGEAALKMAPLVNMGPGAADRTLQVPIAFKLVGEEL